MDVRWTFLFLALFGLTATYKQPGGCYFPERWEGTWFQSGVRQSVIIEGPRLSSKGRCLDSEGDKFLLLDDKRACYRCVVIHEKHANVLQYKETFCHARVTLAKLCSLITGDAPLYSMFREAGVPEQCPFRGPFTFTYNRGHGECRSPVSSIDQCSEDSRLLLHYQACPDVYGSESAVEELQCLAVWKEGNSRYLVGKVHHSHATSNEDRFRCFVYEKAPQAPGQGVLGTRTPDQSQVDYRVAQSGDATCNGLFSAAEGSRTMTLRKASSWNKCRFPGWAANSGHWHTLDYSGSFSFHHRNSTLRITNSTGLEMKLVCARRNESTGLLVAHFTVGCQSGFMCMAFHGRDIHVMEVQMGSHVRRPEDACATPYFNGTHLPFITLVTNSPQSRKCPFKGKFAVDSLLRSGDREDGGPPDDGSYLAVPEYLRGRLPRAMRRLRRGTEQATTCDSDGYTGLVIGCRGDDTMEFRAECPRPDLITSYICHGRWEENDTGYLIATPVGAGAGHETSRRHCFMYRASQPQALLFSASRIGCDRSLVPGQTGDLIFNLTQGGKCKDGSARLRTSGLLVILVTVVCNILNNIMIDIKR